MENKEMIKLYKQMLKEIITSNNHNEISLDKKFEFINNNDDTQNIVIDLSNEEIEDVLKGNYNFKTSLLKELEYIVNIKNKNAIVPLKSIEEKQIYLKAIKSIKKGLIKKYIFSIIKDFKYSFSKDELIMTKEKISLYVILQAITLSIGGLSTLMTFLFALLRNCSFLIPAILLPLSFSPTLYLNLSDFIKARRDSRLETYDDKKLIKQLSITSNNLLKNFELTSLKEPKLLEEKTDQKLEKNMQDPVLNEISNLIELLSNSNLDQQTIQNYLSKIKSIKEAYASRISQINGLSVDNEYTIQGYFIQEIAKLEYKINASITQNRETIQNQTESNLIDTKIYSLEQRTKNR